MYSSIERVRYHKISEHNHGLDGVLYSMPVSDILTFIIAVVIIAKTYRELNMEGASKQQPESSCAGFPVETKKRSVRLRKLAVQGFVPKGTFLSWCGHGDSNPNAGGTRT